jgi:hypothetical protein
MPSSNRKSEKRRLEKEQKKTEMGKYGQVQLKHSRGGIYSCVYAAAAFILLAAAVLFAFSQHGNSQGFAGGLGAVAVVAAAMGIRMSVAGRRERERKYRACWIGLALNVILLVFLLVIFIGGLM